MTARRLTGLATLSLALGLALGCQSIAGIEDRHYEPGVTGSPACEAYCTQVMDACSGSLAAYPDRDTCILTCAALPSGETVNDDSLECRTDQAGLAATTGEPEVHCKGAGPFGAGTCGSTCHSYCNLLAAACPDALADISNCETLCSGLRSDGEYDLASLSAGDNVECRVAHATLAFQDPDTHCPAAAMKSAVCADPKDGAPSCEDYCKLVTTACTGENSPYESSAQCLAVCAKLDKGTNGDTSENTVGCRKYHAYNAVAAPAQHCPHAGPGGDGHCGEDNCESYCKLLSATCASDFAKLYTDETTCRSQCATLVGAGDDVWAKTPKVGNNVRCRLINAARAAEDPTTHCAAAAGGGECQ